VLGSPRGEAPRIHNDKAGSKLNLVRWASARTVKETLSPPRDYKYPFMAEE
jgi:1-pyrroline-5-carboxylate dehydrogenase